MNKQSTRLALKLNDLSFDGFISSLRVSDRTTLLTMTPRVWSLRAVIPYILWSAVCTSQLSLSMT